MERSGEVEGKRGGGGGEHGVAKYKLDNGTKYEGEEDMKKVVIDKDIIEIDQDDFNGHFNLVQINFGENIIKDWIRTFLV